MCDFLILSVKTNIGNIKEIFVNKTAMFPSNKFVVNSIKYPLIKGLLSIIFSLNLDISIFNKGLNIISFEYTAFRILAET